LHRPHTSEALRFDLEHGAEVVATHSADKKGQVHLAARSLPMGTIRWVLAVAALVAMGSAHAGDIYTCKGANGVNTYQNTPCATSTKQLGHQTYSADMARAPAPSADEYGYGSSDAAPRMAPRAATAGGGQAAAPAQQSFGHGLGTSAYQRGEVRTMRCVNARGQVYFTRDQCGTSTVATGVAPRAWQKDQVQGMPDAVMVGPDQALNPVNGRIVNLTPEPTMVPTFHRSQDQGSAADANDACTAARKAATGRFDRRADQRVQDLCRSGRSLYDQPRSSRP
jgi:hypothetical protein